MNLSSSAPFFDEDAWLGTGTVTGIHTYNNRLKVNDFPIERSTDAENTIQFENDGVVVAKNLRVLGQLITPGFPPQGDGSALPANPTFETITTTSSINVGSNVLSNTATITDTLTVEKKLRLNASGSLVGYQDQPLLQVFPNETQLYGLWNFVNAPVQFDATQYNVGGMIGTSDQPNMLLLQSDELFVNGKINFANADVSGLNAPSYASITETADRINITKRVNTTSVGREHIHFSVHEGPTLREMIFQNDDRAMFQLLYDVSQDKYKTIDWSHETQMNMVKTSHIHPLVDSVHFMGDISFADATVTGLPNFSMTEYDDHVDMTKRLTVSHIGWHNNNPIVFQGNLDFSNATVTGINVQAYPSVTEGSDRISFDKPIDVGITSVITPFVGTDDAGIELEENAKRINMMLNDRNMVWSIFENPTTGVTTTIDYAQSTLLNHAQPHSISPRPGYNKIDFSGVMDFGDATIEGFLPGLSANSATNRLVVDTGTTLYFADSMANPGIATEISETQIHTNFCGGLNNGWRFTTFATDSPLIKAVQGGKDIMFISEVEVVTTVPITTTKKGSSGNFTHCHLTEGAQSTNWEVGRCVTSTGEYCARDDQGNLIATPTAAPDASYAMCKVDYSVVGDRALGIIASVPLVNTNEVLHEHGGLTLKARVTENDGHKMVRVASSGDVLAWVLEPTFTEIDLPPLSGLYEKCVDNNDYYGGHTVLSTHVGLEADGYLSVDNQIIDTSEATVEVKINEVCIYPPSPSLTPSLFSGVYNKTINGINQPIQIVMHCNNDYSFSFSEHFPSFEQRVAALEATIAELTGPD